LGNRGVIGKASAVFDDMKRPSRYKALYGGRGSAKSHFFAEALVGCAAESKGFRAVCIREVQKTLKESAKRLIEDKIAVMGFADRFEVLHDNIKTPAGGVIIFQGMVDHTAESIKSLEGFNVAWCEEAQTLSAKSLELLRPTIRSPRSELWFSWNPRSASDPVDEFFRGLTPPENAIIRRISYEDNDFFPNELEEERRHDFKHNPDRYAHIWLGEYEPQAIGAIWTRQMIHDGRIERTEEQIAEMMERIVVAVDPAVTDTETSDEHGICVCGYGHDGRGYLIEDASLTGSPHQWATRAVAMYDKWSADAIVYERNQGGDMVLYTLQTIRKSAHYIDVWAARGKHVRAEPISALYSTGRVSHIGSFPELESQLCMFTSSGYDGDDSPDRAEAMIWGMTELFPKLTTEVNAPVTVAPAIEGGWMG